MPCAAVPCVCASATPAPEKLMLHLLALLGVEPDQLRRPATGVHHQRRRGAAGRLHVDAMNVLAPGIEAGAAHLGGRLEARQAEELGG